MGEGPKEAPSRFLHLIGFVLSSTILFVEFTCSSVNSLSYSSLLSETSFGDKGCSAMNFLSPFIWQFHTYNICVFHIYIYEYIYMNIYKFIYETYTILGFDISPQVTLNLKGLSPIFFPSFPSSLPLSTCSPILVPPHSRLSIHN